jgi:hypothetical protein
MRGAKVKTDERREKASMLRDRGLTTVQIARRLGVSRHAVHLLLRPPVPCTVRCTEFQTVIYTGPQTLFGGGEVRCLSCLCTQPRVTFGQRLRSARITSGLSLRRLSEETGGGDSVIKPL